MPKTLKETIRSFEARINDAQHKLEAWENVSFSYKKDGTPYQNMKKGISGATVYTKESWYAGDKNELTVYFRDGGYSGSDTIYLYVYTNYMSKDELEKLDQSRICENTYVFNFEEVKKAVSDRIEQLKKYIAEKQKSLERIALLESAMAVVKRENEKLESEDKDLAYAFREWCKDAYYKLDY